MECEENPVGQAHFLRWAVEFRRSIPRGTRRLFPLSLKKEFSMLFQAVPGNQEFFFVSSGTVISLYRDQSSMSEGGGAFALPSVMLAVQR
jgi:hypothetical protein